MGFPGHLIELFYFQGIPGFPHNTDTLVLFIKKNMIVHHKGSSSNFASGIKRNLN